jgi:hypothetical protein
MQRNKVGLPYSAVAASMSGLGGIGYGR